MKSSQTPSFAIGATRQQVTLAMLCDFLDNLTVLHYPGIAKWRLRGFAVLPSDSTVTEGIPSSQVLYVTRSREGERLMERHPSSLFLVVHDGDEPPAWTARFSDRIMVVKYDRAYSFILFQVQEFFLNMQFWFSSIEHIVLSRGTLQDLVNASVDVLENFTAIVDASNALSACSRTEDLPDAICSSLVQQGYLTLASASQLGIDGHLGHDVARRSTAIRANGSTLETYVFPIWGAGVNYGSCILCCDKHPMTEGMMDFSRLFVDLAGRLCARLWHDQAENSSADDVFLSNLADGKKMDAAYVRARLERLGVPQHAQYKLVRINPPAGRRLDNPASIMTCAKRLNATRSIPFRHKGDFLSLLYVEETDDGTFSIVDVSDDIQRELCDPQDVYVGTSQVFDDIRDLDLALRQAILACDYREAIDLERSMSPQHKPRRVYAFEDALLYYLIDTDAGDVRFRRFAFSHSFLDKVLERDKASGGNDFALLWVYLNCDCNISHAAKKLFMHRNTVLYHIDRIKENFHIDFSDKGTRDRCLVDYKLKFLEAIRARGSEGVSANRGDLQNRREER